MKGYIVNSKCYIFPQTAAEIPAVEADVFYVQEEDFAAWVAANESIADKLNKYNYNVMTVNPKEWAGHVNDDLEPPVVLYDITYSGDTTHVTGPATGEAGDTITITATTQDEFADITLSSSDAVITKNADNWTFTMPEADVAIAVAYSPVVLYDITKIGNAAEYISAPTQAEADEEVTVTLVDGENYTFDLTNKQKQRIMFRPEYIEAKEYYDSENDKYVYPMPSENQNIEATFKNGYTLSVTIDGTPASISDLNVIMGVYDNYMGVDITDLTDVFGGDDIQLNVQEGYTFDTSATEGTVVIAELNGTELTHGAGHYRSFTMPSENSTLAITLSTLG